MSARFGGWCGRTTVRGRPPAPRRRGRTSGGPNGAHPALPGGQRVDQHLPGAQGGDHRVAMRSWQGCADASYRAAPPGEEGGPEREPGQPVHSTAARGAAHLPLHGGAGLEQDGEGRAGGGAWELEALRPPSDVRGCAPPTARIPDGTRRPHPRPTERFFFPDAVRRPGGALDVLAAPSGRRRRRPVPPGVRDLGAAGQSPQRLPQPDVRGPRPSGAARPPRVPGCGTRHPDRVGGSTGLASEHAPAHPSGRGRRHRGMPPRTSASATDGALLRTP